MRILGFCWSRPYVVGFPPEKTSRFVTFAARGRPRSPKTSRFVTFASCPCRLHQIPCRTERVAEPLPDERYARLEAYEGLSPRPGRRCTGFEPLQHVVSGRRHQSCESPRKQAACKLDSSPKGPRHQPIISGLAEPWEHPWQSSSGPDQTGHSDQPDVRDVNFYMVSRRIET